MCYFGTAEFYNGVRGKDIEGPDANLARQHPSLGRPRHRRPWDPAGLQILRKEQRDQLWYQRNHRPSTNIHMHMLTKPRPLRPPRHNLRRAPSLRRRPRHRHPPGLRRRLHPDRRPALHPHRLRRSLPLQARRRARCSRHSGLTYTAQTIRSAGRA